MSVLSDSIESFIQELFGVQSEIELQRNALAQYFSCAPSQINYVLATRFTLPRGYMIVSKRGSGGSIRIVRVDTDKNKLLHTIVCGVDESMEQREAYHIIERLLSLELISDREAALLTAGTDLSNVPTQDMQNTIRARTMKNMLSALMQ